MPKLCAGEEYLPAAKLAKKNENYRFFQRQVVLFLLLSAHANWIVYWCYQTKKHQYLVQLISCQFFPVFLDEFWRNIFPMLRIFRDNFVKIFSNVHLSEPTKGICTMRRTGCKTRTKTLPKEIVQKRFSVKNICCLCIFNFFSGDLVTSSEFLWKISISLSLGEHRYNFSVHLRARLRRNFCREKVTKFFGHHGFHSWNILNFGIFRFLFCTIGTKCSSSKLRRTSYTI